MSWQEQPALDRLAAVPTERDVERVECSEPGVDRLEQGTSPARPRVRQGGLPEGVEVRGLMALGAIDREFLQGKIEARHGTSWAPACPEGFSRAVPLWW